MLDWAREAKAALDRGPAAMVSVIASQGSAPRDAGTRMVVTGDSVWGTIGGGRLEFLAMAQARKILDHPAGCYRVQDYPLGPLLGQCCGGKVSLLVERLDPAKADWLDEAAHGGTLITELTGETPERRVVAQDGSLPSDPANFPFCRPDELAEKLPPVPLTVLLFGAGHVGRAIHRAAHNLPLALQWYDTRAEWADLPEVTLAPEGELLTAAASAPADAAVLILTHDHGLDYRLSSAALTGKAQFVGLIGSKTKRARFLSRLAKDGVDTARLTCPIGLPGIPGKSPEAIAIATVAQLLTLGSAA